MDEDEAPQLLQPQESAKPEPEVDEDGFTLVTRGGAYGKTLGGGVGVASKRFMQDQAVDGAGAGATGKRHRKKKEKKEKEAFYAFQVHEKKRNGEYRAVVVRLERLSLSFVAEIIDLKKKFEEDKAKIEKLKQSRKFKPY